MSPSCEELRDTATIKCGDEAGHVDLLNGDTQLEAQREMKQWREGEREEVSQRCAPMKEYCKQVCSGYTKHCTLCISSPFPAAH